MRLALLCLALGVALGILASRYVPSLLKPAPARLRGMAAQPCPLPDVPKLWVDTDEPDPIGICRYHLDNLRLIASGERPEVVFFGDSIFEFWDARDPGFFTEGRVNRGIGLQSSPLLLARFRHDVAPLKPHRVHILAGLNDIAGNGGISSPDSFILNIETIVDLAEAEGIVPVLATVPPANPFKRQGMVDPADWIPELNRRLKSLAAKRGLAIADYHAVLAGPDGHPRPGLYLDSGHPNRAGYQAMRPVALGATGSGSVTRLP